MEIKKIALTVALCAIALGSGFFAGYQMAPKPSEPTGPEEPATLRIWGLSFDEPYWLEMIKWFEELHPNIECEWTPMSWMGQEQAYAVALASDDPPDILHAYPYQMQEFFFKGQLEDLTPYFNELPKETRDDVVEGALEASSANGKIFCIPYRTDASVLVYNKKMWEAAGITEPPTTWEEFVEVAEKLTIVEGGETVQYGLGLEMGTADCIIGRFMGLVWSNGGDMLSEDLEKATINEKPAVEALEFLVDLLRKYKVMPESSLTDNDKMKRELFAAGRVAMGIDGVYFINIIPKLGMDPGNVGFALLPWSKPEYVKTTFNNHGAPNSVAMASACKHKEAAWQFIRFMLRPLMQVWYERTLPTLKSIREHYRFIQAPALKSYVEALDYARTYPTIPKMAEMQQSIWEAIQKAALGEATPQAALDEAATKIDEILATS